MLLPAVRTVTRSCSRRFNVPLSCPVRKSLTIRPTYPYIFSPPCQSYRVMLSPLFLCTVSIRLDAKAHDRMPLLLLKLSKTQLCDVR